MGGRAQAVACARASKATSAFFVKKGHRMTARAEQAHVCREPSSRRAASPLHHIAPPARTPARRRSVGVSDHAVEVAGREYARR
eukprot:COSAG06_NODE_1859_length_8205_cov_15.172095_1_plen_84_part_00